eukprot:365542-Chlamydomonas_euryale.AAC.34
MLANSDGKSTEHTDSHPDISKFLKHVDKLGLIQDPSVGTLALEGDHMGYRLPRLRLGQAYMHICECAQDQPTDCRYSNAQWPMPHQLAPNCRPPPVYRSFVMATRSKMYHVSGSRPSRGEAMRMQWEWMETH